MRKTYYVCDIDIFPDAGSPVQKAYKFYEQLQQLTKIIPRLENIITIDNINKQVGNDVIKSQKKTQ